MLKLKWQADSCDQKWKTDSVITFFVNKIFALDLDLSKGSSLRRLPLVWVYVHNNCMEVSQNMFIYSKGDTVKDDTSQISDLEFCKKRENDYLLSVYLFLSFLLDV